MRKAAPFLLAAMVLVAAGLLWKVLSHPGAPEAAPGPELTDEEMAANLLADLSPEQMFKLIEEAEKSEVRDANAVDLTVTIRPAVGAAERDARYAQPLEEALGDLGDVTAGGTLYENVDGRMETTASEIEVTVYDIDKALPLVRETLKQAGAPKGTTITRYQPEKTVLPLAEE